MGRKIGFTNRTAWVDYKVNKPMWGYVYDRTVHNLAELGDTFSLMPLAEPRIEPEIVFGLATAPVPGMDERTLLESVDWVAHGFEVVQSIFLDGNFPFPIRSRRLACTVPCLSGLVTRSQCTPRIGAEHFRLSKSI
jgi:2-oxo-3-hexenedioate decarboxylase